MAWGSFLFLKPLVLIEALHQGEENSAYTRWYLNFWSNRWMSDPFWVRTVGAIFFVVGAYLLVFGVLP
jgi:nitric oxide reductase large subunit